MYHFIGIDEEIMCALAQTLKSLGYSVNGSVSNYLNERSNSLLEKGIEVEKLSRDNISDDMIIVIDNNISEDNEELVRAQELKLKIYTSYHMLKRLTELFRSIIVIGSNDKEIINNINAYTLSNIIGCNYLLSSGEGFASKENKYFCIEADEDKKNFLDYNPYYAVITGIDLVDNNYETIDEIIATYQEFANKAEKMVIACGDDSYTHMIECSKPIFYYGLNEDNDIVAKEIEYKTTGTSFEVYVEDNYYGSFDLPIYGKQMLLNVLSVIAICYYERIEEKYVTRVLKSFFEAKEFLNEEKISDIIFLMICNNNPKSIKNNIKALRQKYPNKKLNLVFSSDIISEEEKFLSNYIDSFNLADNSYILGENNKLLDQVKKKQYFKNNDLDRLLDYKDNVLILINSKDISNIYDCLNIESNLKKQSIKIKSF